MPRVAPYSSGAILHNKYSDWGFAVDGKHRWETKDRVDDTTIECMSKTLSNAKAMWSHVPNLNWQHYISLCDKTGDLGPPPPLVHMPLNGNSAKIIMHLSFTI